MRIQVLDHGYVEEVEHWGSDERIIEAARMSTGKGFLGWGPIHSDGCPRHHSNIWHGLTPECDCTPKPGDEKLLRFLWEHKHTTPFETPGLEIKVECPVVVIWQWVRHRTLTYNILSGRYTQMPNVNYIPTIERLMIGSDGKNRQAGTVAGAEVLTADKAQHFRESIQEQYKVQQELYEWALKSGVPKELARLALTFARYSRMSVTGNLWNWLRFLTLRMAKDAQWEIRQFANAAGTLIAKHFPRTWHLFAESLPAETRAMTMEPVCHQ